MSQVAIVVEYQVKPARRVAFEGLIRAHAAGTKEDEDGCERFDVLIPREDPGRVMVYEIYRDEEAYREHNASPRLFRVREDYKDMIDDRRIVVCDVKDS